MYVTCSIPQAKVNSVAINHYISAEVIKDGRDIVLHYNRK